MTTTQQLNTQFGINGRLNFVEDTSGLVVAKISNTRATASLCLQGGHLMTWQPANQAAPVIWLSRDAKLAAGKSIRGGVPVCWPWFGPHATESDYPGHGYARTVPWRVLESADEPDGATRLKLRLQESDKTRSQWPHACTLDLTVIVGNTLRMEMTTANTGTSDFTIGEALHTYFRIGDIGSVRVNGLDGCAYWDKVGGSVKKTQEGAVDFTGETDRVYIRTTDDCVIEDTQLGRRIFIAKSGSRSTVVWTPWTDKAVRMGDLGQPDGWREMVCVETANALDDVVTIAAGTQHTLRVEYRVDGM